MNATRHGAGWMVSDGNVRVYFSADAVLLGAGPARDDAAVSRCVRAARRLINESKGA